MTAYDDWRDGAITPEQALHRLASDLGDVESELEPLQREREQLRNAISHVLATVGCKAMIPGFGALVISEPSKVVSYDGKALQGVVNELVTDGYGDIAERILQCQKVSARAGTLRITREQVHR